MKTIGFLISHKVGEKRRALLPEHISIIKNKEWIYIETGYGNAIGICDDDYVKAGVHVVSREEVLKCDILTDVKLGDADYLEQLDNNKILFGWAHAVQGIDFTSSALLHGHTVIAWEEIFEDGRYIFYRNREVAGEAAILQAYRYCGKMPYDTKVAIIGNGQTAKWALRVLHGLGAEVDVYGRKLELLFKKKMYEYDVIVNCVMWDTSRTDRIIYKADLKKMRPGTLIIDVSCDPNLEIETTRATTIEDPIYEIDGVIHYAVDNTPAMYPITISKVLSEGISKYIDEVIEENYSEAIQSAMVIHMGHILDKRILEFRDARGFFCQ